AFGAAARAGPAAHRRARAAPKGLRAAAAGAPARAFLTGCSHPLTGAFKSCAESATTRMQPHCCHVFWAFPPLRRPPTWLWSVLRIHAWDRLSVATRRQHTPKSVVAFR